ncbi:MAG: MFS transporter [Pseudomonadales bacterium RIFCSPLOWO2_12_60_38]|jgi:predicted MFS family arabinose efflux permease|uniref:MFS transporter n=2 Tax=Pseudomonas TaxID=286 RepID=A0ABU6BQX1_9PSED|nr:MULTISPECIES: MFS transporter [Pseudomonas]AOS75605.1 MFS transporter [Pseudomonas fluorescens]MDN5400104.1 MFS transporter [Pseudomonas sp.]MDN5420548.1 MFS transporter [Pseudomonadales bacterium]NLT89808.1 MFS transporter [Pseudomonas lactis]OHC31704.1 MAG: MFS transporter [Pseudomonadales bacterium RIFCSPLOWO2_12_60_38]OHC41335.1 MAG: MFS transporter [Pseudomonadales bacterium RIFCSPLOWO2_12_FULL_59_450]PMZ73913.1 MFS transporter [Pseudomonas sp. GW247-3R2A]
MMGTYRALRGLNARLQLLFLITLVFRMGTMAFPFYAAYLIHQHAVSAGTAGLLVGVYGAGALFVDLIIGGVIKRFSANRVILGSLLLNAVLLLIIPSVDNTVVLFVLSFLWGGCYEAFTPATFSETVAHSSSESRKVAFSCNRLAINIGMAIGPLLGSLIFLSNADAVFYLNAALSLVAFIACLWFGRTVPVTQGAGVASKGNGLPESAMHERSRLLVILLAALPVHIAYALPPTFLSAYIINYTELPAYYVGIIFFINALLVILFEVPINQRMSHLSSSRSLVAGFLMAGVGFFLMGFSHIGALLLAATVLWSLGEMVVFPGITHYVSSISSRHTVDRNLGYYSAGVNIGVMITPPLAFMLMSQPSLPSPWLLAGTVLLLFAVAVGVMKGSAVLWNKEA